MSEVQDITQNEILRGKWLVGSSLMAHDFRALETGCYCYEQDTIWQKALNVTAINPYWEIHNRTDNYLFKNQSLRRNSERLVAYAADLLPEAMSWHVVTCLPELASLMRAQGWQVYDAKIDFALSGELVGSYAKVFCQVDGSYYPLIDCTVFDLEGDHYFEINHNLFYGEMVTYLNSGKYPDKWRRLAGYFDFDFSECLVDLDKCRLLSLIDAILYLDQNRIRLASSYGGHSLKRLLKELVFYGLVTNQSIETLLADLSQDYQDFARQELTRYDRLYPGYLASGKADLAGTYGMTLNMQAYLEGRYQGSCYEIKTARYFTDLPFCQVSDLAQAVTHILEGKTA